jgi:hypothetical protein
MWSNSNGQDTGTHIKTKASLGYIAKPCLKTIEKQTNKQTLDARA